MKLDIKRAFLLPFSGYDWLPRLIVLSVLSFSAIDYDYKLYSFIILVPLWSLLLGYLSQFMHNEINNIYPSLPSWKLDILRYFRYGFICSIGILIYFIISCFFILPIGVLAKMIHNNYLEYLYNFMNQIGSTIFIIVPCLYSDNFKFKDILNFPLLRKFIFNAKLEFFISLSIYLILHQIIDVFFFTKKIIFIKTILISIILAITFLIVFNLFAQTYKLSKQIMK